MDGSVRISKADRKRYLAVVNGDQRVTRATISRAKTWHVEGGADHVLAERRGQRADYGGCVGTLLM